MMLSTYCSEFCAKETLLNARPDCDGDDEELLLADHLLEGGHQQPQPGQLLLVLLLVRDAKLCQWVDKECNQSSGCYGTSEEDAHDYVDLVGVDVKVAVENLYPFLWRSLRFCFPSPILQKMMPKKRTTVASGLIPSSLANLALRQ